MAIKSLAVKYRPNTFSDVVEQGATVAILNQQLSSKQVKNAYLFCGGAGTGKTTCARIFANEINQHQGNPIEMDAASNNSVDDVREIIQQAKTKSLDSEYKVFIIDECHSLSNTAWQAMLKLIEEPPAKSIFIFCTTDPQKIPKTILSRVQRYEFQRISFEGIVNRMQGILGFEGISYKPEAINYIAKLADGGMRDALTMLDKCIAYGELTEDNVVKALGVANYDTMFTLNDLLFSKDKLGIITTIENIHKQGLDLKQFIKQYLNFTLDICKYWCCPKFDFIAIPTTYEQELRSYGDYEFNTTMQLLDTLIKLNTEIKWDLAPKAMIQATLLLECANNV